LTVRLPYDLYREVSRRAETRGWSISDYVAYCVGREVLGKVAGRAITPRRGRALASVAAAMPKDDAWEGGDGD
jgi:hypothetical protein